VVTNPIDLLRVQQKLKTDSYEDVEELTADIELLVNNAKAFYKPDSTEYQDACALLEVFKSNKTKLLEAADDASSLQSTPVEAKPRTGRAGRPRKSMAIDDDQMSENSSENNDYDPYEELFSAVMNATEDNRPLHTMFQLLPSKKLYPEYYEIIDHPIDLKFIANKIQTNAYNSLNEMEKDLLQMCKNACTFNEPGSQIYKDAKTLKRIFQQRKIELESGKYRRSGRRRTGQSLSSVCAALKEDPESSEEELDEEMDGDQSGPLWQLFDYLYNQASIAGECYRF
jgi:protein polybromo-1